MIPLADCADETIRALATVTASTAIGRLTGATLLGERSMLAGRKIPGRVSAGAGCRLFDAVGDTVALNLARPADRDLMPALLETDDVDPRDDAGIAACIARSDAAALVERGRSMGLAIAREREAGPNPAAPVELLVDGPPAPHGRGRAPRVLDLSALWGGPLAAHLLWLAGAEVVKVESRTRPDAMRADERFYSLLNQGKSSVVLDFADADDRRALIALIGMSDIVIEAARPRALAQLGIVAEQIVSASPGLVWVTITGHGAAGRAAEWVGFGDDCGVAGGLSAALRAAGGRCGFVGDAIADPLTGISAALAAWTAWRARRGGRFGIAMSQVVAQHLSRARSRDPAALDAALKAWGDAVGEPFPVAERRPFSAAAAFGAHTRVSLARAAAC